MGWGWVDDVFDAIGDFGSEAIDTVVGYGGDIVDWVSEAIDYVDPAETDWDSDFWDMDDNIGEISDGYYAVEEPVSTFDFTNDWADIEDAFEGEAMTDASGYDNDANWVGEGPEPDVGSDLFDKAKAQAKKVAANKAKQVANKLLGGAPVSPIPAGLPTAGVDPNLLAALVAGQTQLPAPTPAAVAEIPFGPVDPYSGNILEPDRRDLRAPVRSAAQGGIIENKTAEILRILGNKYG